MNFDPEKLKNMSPEELSAGLEAVAQAMGIDPAVLAKAVGDPALIKKKLSGMNEADIRRISSSIDPETQKKLNKILGGQHGTK